MNKTEFIQELAVVACCDRAEAARLGDYLESQGIECTDNNGYIKIWEHIADEHWVELLCQFTNQDRDISVLVYRYETEADYLSQTELAGDLPEVFPCWEVVHAEKGTKVFYDAEIFDEIEAENMGRQDLDNL